MKQRKESKLASSSLGVKRPHGYRNVSSDDAVESGVGVGITLLIELDPIDPERSLPAGREKERRVWGL
jgi:hypothetical protein